MGYHVELANRAVRDLTILYVEKQAADSITAARWFNGLEEAVYSLENLPSRCPAAPESKVAGRTLRHLLYGKKPHVYRIIFELDERRKLVTVLTIRHGAMEPMGIEELM
jgi:toxin ParE1/3/4